MKYDEFICSELKEKGAAIYDKNFIESSYTSQ